MQEYACLQARPAVGAMLSASTALRTSDAPPPHSTHTYQPLPHFRWRHQLIQSNPIQSKTLQIRLTFKDLRYSVPLPKASPAAVPELLPSGTACSQLDCIAPSHKN